MANYCSACKKVLPSNRFSINIKSNKYFSACDKCKAYLREYHEKNKTLLLSKQKIRYVKNKKELNKKQHMSRKLNPDYKIKCRIRARIYLALRRGLTESIVEKDLGCSLSFYRKYIEARWKEGMSWNNYGSAWVVDHIIPLGKYDLRDKGMYNTLVHYINTQPLFTKDNLEKGMK